MAANSESVITAKTQCVKKVSKPLMEKKRRARINKCLNQLKSLLETIYSNNIRKRKLEKADILELTVKHLRVLQNTERGPSTCRDSAEYQAGYRNCLVGVSQYLLMSDTHKDSPSMLSHLASGLTDSRVLHFSTAESDASNAQRQSLKTDAPRSCIQPHSFNRPVSKRTEMFDPDRLSLSQAGSPESTQMKTRHFSPKNAKVDQRFFGAFKQNYWRPW